MEEEEDEQNRRFGSLVFFGFLNVIKGLGLE